MRSVLTKRQWIRVVWLGAAICGLVWVMDSIFSIERAAPQGLSAIEIVAPWLMILAASYMGAFLLVKWFDQ
jgi:hypothetical protein